MENFRCSLEKRGSKRFGGLMRSGSFGSKRVAFDPMDDVEYCFQFQPFDLDSTTPTPTKKKLCVMQDPIFTTQQQQQDKSPLQSLPQDILIRVLCGVEHDDLKNLVFVSKSVSEATLIANKLHFAYTTPRKTVGFRDHVGGGADDDLNEYVAQFGALAPKGSRIRNFQISHKKKKLAHISVTLFA